MKNINVLNSTILNLPITRNGNDYFKALKILYKEFLTSISLFEGNLGISIRKNIHIIQEEIDLILESNMLYFEGKTSQSYDKICKCLELLESNNILEIGNITGDFYRIRTAQSSNLKRGDLFHIPFQIREKVATQRYSIPGLPCLYMADSIFTAWEEMGRPEFNSIHVSRFNFDSVNFKLLFLNVTTSEMRKRCINGNKIIFENHIVKFLSYWPILAACSFNVFKREDVFKPEYLIPQMVLQWIIENKNIDGIQFKSNRIKISNQNIGSFNNIAIPVQTSKENGFCDILKNKIKLTSPLSWSLMDIADPNQTFLKKSNEDISVEKIRTASYIELIEDEKTDYFKTKFGIMEEKLKSMSIQTINT